MAFLPCRSCRPAPRVWWGWLHPSPLTPGPRSCSWQPARMRFWHFHVTLTFLSSRRVWCHGGVVSVGSSSGIGWVCSAAPPLMSFEGRRESCKMQVFFFFPFLSRLSDYQQLGTDSAVVLQACSKQGETYSEARTLASKSPQSSVLAMEQWAACSRGQRCLSKRFWKKTAQSVPVLPFNVGVVLCKRFPGGLHGGTGRAYFPSNMEEMGWSVVFDYSLSCIKENMSLLRIVF